MAAVSLKEPIAPTQLAGMALIDSTAPVSAPIPPTTAAGSYDPKSRIAGLLSSTARFGLMRLVVGLSGDTLPPASERAERASLATTEHLRSTIDEYLEGGISAKEASSLTTFGDKPLFVLTAGEGSSAGWMPRQDSLAALSTNAAHHVVEEGHVGLRIMRILDLSAQAMLVELVDQAHGRRPLHLALIERLDGGDAHW